MTSTMQGALGCWVPTWAGTGAARPSLRGFALALDFLEHSRQPGIDAAASAGLGAAGATGAA